MLAILRQQCPRCHSGRLFTGLMQMRIDCPLCQLRFEREEGYWTGAMMINWILISFTLLPLGAILLITGRPFPLVLLLIAVLVTVLLPVYFRYSRIIWLHVDHRADVAKE
jgi:uncharacterized protein (DUF983 family)